jgi:hypothetical protein
MANDFSTSTSQKVDLEKIRMSGKLTRTDIVNALNSTDITKVLSAAQGKALADSKLNKTGDTMTGDLTIQADKKLSAYGTQLGVPSNDNLLINSHFRSPINQRELVDYTENYKFTIDMWELLSGGPTGMHLYPYPNEDFIAIVYGNAGATYFVQSIEHPESVFGTYTFSYEYCVTAPAPVLFYIENNTGVLFSQWYVGDNAWHVGSITGNIPTGSTFLRACFSIRGAGTLYLRWAKLEKGSISTPFALRRPSIEELMCEKHFRRIKKFVSGVDAYYHDGRLWTYINGLNMRTGTGIVTLKGTPNSAGGYMIGSEDGGNLVDAPTWAATLISKDTVEIITTLSNPALASPHLITAFLSWNASIDIDCQIYV